MRDAVRENLRLMIITQTAHPATGCPQGTLAIASARSQLLLQDYASFSLKAAVSAGTTLNRSPTMP